MLTVKLKLIHPCAIKNTGVLVSNKSSLLKNSEIFVKVWMEEPIPTTMIYNDFFNTEKIFFSPPLEMKCFSAFLSPRFHTVNRKICYYFPRMTRRIPSKESKRNGEEEEENTKKKRLWDTFTFTPTWKSLSQFLLSSDLCTLFFRLTFRQSTV